MGALTPLALSIAPEISRWLDGATAETAIASVVQTATGTSDPAAAAAVIQRDSAAAGELRTLLAKWAAGQDSAARAADLETLSKALRGATDTSTSASAVTIWSAPVVSGIVLLTFGTVMTLVLVYGVPSGSDTVANMLLGTLAAMATSVVSYWVGSSAGSARKDERLSQIARPATAS